MKALLLSLLLLGTIVSGGAMAEIRLTAWSDSVFEHIEKEYGKAARKRMHHLYDLVQDNMDLDIEDKLELVNRELNALPWIADQEKYSRTDYWATPLETIATFGGDCEDIAIAKAMMLRLMGVPAHNIYLGFVKIRRTGESHMVAVWLADDREQAIVLDNYSRRLRKAGKRDDLEFVMLFDDNGKTLMIDDDGRNPDIRREIDGKRLEKLNTVFRRMKENQESWKQYNGGQPVILGWGRDREDYQPVN